MKKLCEKQAWDVLAKIFEKPVRCKFCKNCKHVTGYYKHNDRTYLYRGMCNYTELFERLNVIELITVYDMRLKIKSEFPIKAGPYLYPTTKAGAKKRVNFCKNQILKLEMKDKR